jgi:hypothetical protein
MPKHERHASRTLLIVGEGDTEVAFLTHVKSLYAPRHCGLAVKVRNARGKGPANVLRTVIRNSRDQAFTLRAALLDTDLQWTQETRELAARQRITLVGSTPCLEGMLLDVLGQLVPGNSSDCKRTFGQCFAGEPLRSEDYAGPFSREVLERARGRVAALMQLLELFR